MLLTTLALLASPLHAQEFPALTGRVVDTANILEPAQEAALDAKLADLEKQSQRQLVVVTIADLQGYDISDYGFRLGDHWGIGDKERDDGALLIVAPRERKVRIEVGYGLEGVLPDILAGRIIRDIIIPRFKANDYPGGIAAGVDAIGRLLLLPPEEARKLAEQAQQQEAQQDNSGGNIVFVIFFILFFLVLPMLRSRRRGRAYGAGLAAPVILWGPGIGGGSSHRSSGSSWSSGGGFSGGGGSFGGGGASGGW